MLFSFLWLSRKWLKTCLNVGNLQMCSLSRFITFTDNLQHQNITLFFQKRAFIFTLRLSDIIYCVWRVLCSSWQLTKLLIVHIISFRVKLKIAKIHIWRKHINKNFQLRIKWCICLLQLTINVSRRQSLYYKIVAPHWLARLTQHFKFKCLYLKYIYIIMESVVSV